MRVAPLCMAVPFLRCVGIRHGCPDLHCSYCPKLLATVASRRRHQCANVTKCPYKAPEATIVALTNCAPADRCAVAITVCVHAATATATCMHVALGVRTALCKRKHVRLPLMRMLRTDVLCCMPSIIEGSGLCSAQPPVC